MLKKIVLSKVRGYLFLYISHEFYYIVSSWCYNVFYVFFSIPIVSFPPSYFVLSLLFISTFHVHARWLVLILVPSTPPLSPHVVAVRLKTTVQYYLHINVARELAAKHLMWWQQLSPKIFQDFSLSNVSTMLINTNETSWNVTMSDRQSLQISALVSRGCIYPRPTLLSHYN